MEPQSKAVQGAINVVADVPERVRAEARRDPAARRTERLVKVTGAIADAVSRAQVFEAVIDQVATALEASSAGLWLLSADGRTAEKARSVGYSLASARALQRLPLREGLMPVLDALIKREPVWIASQQELLEQYPHLATLVTSGRSYRISCLPVVVHGVALGVIAFTFDDAPPLDAEEQSFLLLVARYTGQALERLRLLEDERKIRARVEEEAARLAMLSRASKAFGAQRPNLESLLQAIAEQVTIDYAEFCGIALLSSSGEELEIAALHHRVPEAAAAIKAALLSSPLRLGEGASGRVAATGETLWLPRVEAAALIEKTPPAHREWLQLYVPSSVLIVPLRVAGRVIGTLSAMRQDAQRPFAPEDQRLLEELAERGAMAIEGSRLQRANEQGRVRAELLYELAAAVIGARTLNEVFDTALGGIGKALGAARSAVLVYDPDGVLRFKAWRGLTEDYRRAVEGHSPWTRETRDPQPLLVSDAEQDPSMAPYLPLFKTEGIAALGFIPLVAGGQLLGKFMVYYSAPTRLSSAEVEMAKAIANHVAAAISRFSSISELEQSVRFNELFTGILGHDLRNPLSAIRAAAQLLIKRGESEKLAKPLARILSSGDRMARMIDQLLDFTRVRVGDGIPIKPVPSDAVPMLRQVMEELDDANPGWTIRLERVVGETSAVWDVDRLSQVLSNLIANAVQHGQIEHGVCVNLDGTQADRIQIEVHNHGAVPAALLPKLFEPLAGGGRRSDKSEGLGLGLYISREIVRAHGGQISVQSSEEAGTTFVVSLPRVAQT